MTRLLLLLSLCSFATAAVQAQVRIAPLGSFDFGAPLFINRLAGVLNPFTGSGPGTSSSESYGLGAEFQWPHVLADRLGLIGRIQAVYSAGRFAFDTASYIVSGSEAKLLLDVAPVWNLEPFSMRLGPWISEAIVRNITETNGTPLNAGSSLTHAGVFAGVLWDVTNFPIRPEINTRLDLTQLSAAGSNAWSIGLSLVYDPQPQSASMQASVDAVPAINTNISTPPVLAASANPLSVTFLVNGSEVVLTPPLDRVELQVKEYAMVNRANTPPKITQWIEESYHLPHLSLLCENSNGIPAQLVIRNDDVPIIERSISEDSGTRSKPVILDLDKDSSWQRAVNEMKSTEVHYLVAELHSDTRVSLDTLILPPADSAAASITITKHEYRFKLLKSFNSIKGGSEALALLLDKMKSLLEESPSITILEHGTSSSDTELLDRIKAILGSAWTRALHSESSDSDPYITVVLRD